MTRSRFFLLLLSCAAALFLYALAEPFMLAVTEFSIISADVPAAFDGLRIAFLTDIHHGPYFSLDRVRQAVQRTNALHPDLILLGGDYVFTDPKYIVPCFGELAELQAPLGVFGVLGNHDHWQDAVLTSNSMIDAGIEWVYNRSVWVERDGDRIKIGGVGDLWEGAQNLGATIGDTTAADWVLLLSHNPDYAEQMDTDRVDVVFSGHTHGGQVTLFGLWAPILPSGYGQKYRSGLVLTDHTRVVVSKGIGTIWPPLRLFCRPEIVLVRLSRAP